ncbi:MAG: thiosulfate oxidation carrier protein SoxY [Rhodobacteraceae bacterium]|nr:thiosulfate oxidation carrier protein SoxY [Paracoccaceae bacterium]
MLTRRDTMALSLGAATIAMVPMKASASAVDEAINAFTGGAAIADGGVTVIAPEIAENGENVPVEVEAPGASEIFLLATGNPTPSVARVRFGEASGAPRISTRIRLGETQDVMAIAKLADGNFVRGAAEVRVTIGGCGG